MPALRSSRLRPPGSAGQATRQASEGVRPPPPLLRLRRDASRRSAAFGRAKVDAKGGSRTPIAFRLPDPKSGASASSATFAQPNAQEYHGRGREQEVARGSALGGRRSGFGARRSALGGQGSAFGVRRSALCPRRSAFGARRSTLGVRRSPCDVRRSGSDSMRDSGSGTQDEGFGIRDEGVGMRE
jgi:hypothetical protein